MEAKIFQQLSKIRKLTSLILSRNDLSLYSELKECFESLSERREYAYILCINGKIKKPLAVKLVGYRKTNEADKSRYARRCIRF